MKKIVALVTITIMIGCSVHGFQGGLQALKRAVPKGVSPSPSQSAFQQLKQKIQRKASKRDIQEALQIYNDSLKKPPPVHAWPTQPKIQMLHVATPQERARIKLEQELKKSNPSYEYLAQLLSTIEKNN